MRVSNQGTRDGCGSYSVKVKHPRTGPKGSGVFFNIFTASSKCLRQCFLKSFPARIHGHKNFQIWEYREKFHVYLEGQEGVFDFFLTT